MTTFIVGDVQGCYQELEELLTKCGFEKGNDHLWLVGDLINRGPENVAVLDWIIDTPKVTSVLGNHDLHFLAIALGRKKQSRETRWTIYESPRRDIYIDYLRNLPLIHTTAGNEKVLVHAGLPPNIDVQSCLSLANEVEEVLKSDRITSFLKSMYGGIVQAPGGILWRGQDRLRFITNCFTRMRYCNKDWRTRIRLIKTQFLLPDFNPGIPTSVLTKSKFSLGIGQQ